MTAHPDLSILNILAAYKKPIEEEIAKSIPSFGPKTPLRDAIEYALKNGGKRFRPVIVYMVANALNKGVEVGEVALAVEFFHTASLIADDLPCMDDDDKRREVPSLHKVYGEATAILATYALISAGYDKIRLGAQKLGKQGVCALAVESASSTMGIGGAAGGQYSDLYPSALSEEMVLDVIDKKTGAFFEISFIFGWLFGGGEISVLHRLKAAARSFGRAFQISDDLLDLKQDQGGVNYPAVVGIEKATETLSMELANYYHSLEDLSIATPELLALGNLVEKRVAGVQPTHLMQ